MCGDGRRGSERAIREVRELEDRGAGELRVQAAQYVEALLPPSEAAQGQPCAPSAVRQFCEAAVKQPSQEHQMQLLSDPSAVRSASWICTRTCTYVVSGRWMEVINIVN